MAAETVTFDAGDTSVTVTYTISKDTAMEGYETFTLDLALTGTTNTNMFATLMSPSSATVYITDCTGVFPIYKQNKMFKKLLERHS